MPACLAIFERKRREARPSSSGALGRARAQGLVPLCIEQIDSDGRRRRARRRAESWRCPTVRDTGVRPLTDSSVLIVLRATRRAAARCCRAADRSARMTARGRARGHEKAGRGWYRGVRNRCDRRACARRERSAAESRLRTAVALCPSRAELWTPLRDRLAQWRGELIRDVYVGRHRRTPRTCHSPTVAADTFLLRSLHTMTSARVNPVRLPLQASPSQTFNGVKVFSATMHFPRNALGEVVTQWLAEHHAFRICDFVVRQSSDHGYHCLSICVFYRDLASELGAAPMRPAINLSGRSSERARTAGASVGVP